MGLDYTLVSEQDAIYLSMRRQFEKRCSNMNNSGNQMAVVCLVLINFKGGNFSSGICVSSWHGINPCTCAIKGKGNRMQYIFNFFLMSKILRLYWWWWWKVLLRHSWFRVRVWFSREEMLASALKPLTFLVVHPNSLPTVPSWMWGPSRGSPLSTVV